MTDLLNKGVGRRAFIAGAGGVGLLTLSGCAGLPGFGFTDAIRRLLLLSSERAFARLTPDSLALVQQWQQTLLTRGGGIPTTYDIIVVEAGVTSVGQSDAADAPANTTTTTTEESPSSSTQTASASAS